MVLCLACLFKPEGCPRKNESGISDSGAGCGMHKARARLVSRAGKSLMASQSATVPLTWKIGRLLVIGKGT